MRDGNQTRNFFFFFELKPWHWLDDVFFVWKIYREFIAKYGPLTDSHSNTASASQDHPSLLNFKLNNDGWSPLEGGIYFISTTTAAPPPSLQDKMLQPMAQKPVF